jgi:hypothetical protein
MQVTQQFTFLSAEASIVWRGSMCGLDSSVGTLSTPIMMLGAPPLKDHDRSHENMVSMMCLRNVESAFKGGLSRAIFELADSI